MLSAITLLTRSFTCRYRLAMPLCVFVCAALVAGSLSGCQFRPPLTVTVLFYKSPGLEVGDPVFFQSVRVGEIKAVSRPLTDASKYTVLEVAIEREFSHLLHRQMAFTVNSIRLLNQQRRLVIMDRVASPQLPVEQGDVFIGTTYLRYLFGQTSDIAIDIVEVLKSLSASTEMSPARSLEKGLSQPGSVDTQKLIELLQRYLTQTKSLPQETPSPEFKLFSDSTRSYIN